MKIIPMKLNLKKASEVLQAARKIIRDPIHWIQFTLAEDVDGNACPTKAKNAHAFCALGAVRRINGPKQAQAVAYLREAGKRVGEFSGRLTNDMIMGVNDDWGHTETLQMFSSAIRAAKRDGN